MLTENIFENISEQSNVMIAAELNLEKKKPAKLVSSVTVNKIKIYCAQNKLVLNLTTYIVT